jgi:DNA-binding NtrC family response regulator
MSVIVLTGVSDVDLAVKAMKLGAFDYLTKPVDEEKLLEVLGNAIEHSILHQTIEQLPHDLTLDELNHESAFEFFHTQNQQMIRLFHQAEKIAAGDLSVFISGETGSGKEALARAMHQASHRRDKPFAAVEADSLDQDDFPAFFFGQARDWRGSREETPGLLEETNHGTIFLNNIEELSHSMQVRLLRVIQTGEYYKESSARIINADVRMIVSSSHDLTSPEYQNKFSSDLLYHLMVNSIKIPPLRERKDDIPILVDIFLKQEAEKVGKSFKAVSDEFREFLINYNFPGNIQELITIIASAVVREETDTITLDSIPPFIRKNISSGKWALEEFMPRKLDEVIREHIIQTLEHYGRNMEKAAEKLGISQEEIKRISGVNE